jgi:hypothetical protein
MARYTRHDTKRIALLLPTYDKQSYNRLAVVNFSQEFPECCMVEVCSSALGHCFNVGYQAMIQKVQKGELDYILMLHADIVPIQPHWGSILMDEMIEHQASIMSAVSPIKTEQGLTSTGFFRKEDDEKNFWNPIRLTMKELTALPETFTHPRLIVNTGCMAIDARQQWAQELVFDLKCFVDLKSHRSWYIPEDWLMSKECYTKGGKVYATRKVALEHYGHVGFPNTQPWGTVPSEGAMEVYLKEGYNNG